MCKDRAGREEAGIQWCFAIIQKKVTKARIKLRRNAHFNE